MKSTFSSWFDYIKQAVDKILVSMRRSKQESFDEIQKLTEELHEQQQETTGDQVDPRSLVWKFWLSGIVVALLGYFIFKSLNFIFIILTAFVISMAIENLIGFFERWFSRPFSIGISYCFLIIFVLSGIIIVVPFVGQQVADMIALLVNKLLTFQQNLQQQGLEASILESNLPNRIKVGLVNSMTDNNRGMAMQDAILNNLSQLVSVSSGYVRGAGGLAVTIIGSILAAVIQIGITFVLAIFFSIEKKKVINFLAHVSGHVKYTELKLVKLYRKLGFRLEGQLVLCIAIGIGVWIGLSVVSLLGFHLPNRFTLALIAGLTEFIPYLGPFLGMFPALLLGIAAYGWKGLLVIAILYWFIQRLENNVLVPLVMYHALGISPLMILISMLIGASILGLLGIILAVPTAVILSILFEDYVTTGGTDQ